MRTITVAIALLLATTVAQSQFRGPNLADIDQAAETNNLLAAQTQQIELQNQLLAEQLKNLQLQNARLAAPCESK